MCSWWFPKFSENLENYQFLKIHKKSVISKMSSVCCFFKSTRQVCNNLHLKSIKTALKTLIFFKNFDFCILEPKNREVIEDSTKTTLSFSPLQCTYLAKNSFQYHKGFVRKKKLKSGYLELRFSVYIPKWFMDIQKWFMDIQKWFMDIQNLFMDILNYMNFGYP